MFRYLERAEHASRLIETGFQLFLTSKENIKSEWKSILKTSGSENYYYQNNEQIDSITVIKFILKEPSNPNNILTLLEKARNNAKKSRVSLTKEVWEATNSCWLDMNQMLKKNIYDKDVQNILFQLREKIALIIGYLNNTMLRNEILYFCYLGTYIERFDNTARILDVRHFLFLPNTMIRNDIIGETQWEAILRSLSAYRAYMWQNQNELSAINISNFLLFDEKMPRSLKFSLDQILNYIKLLKKNKVKDSVSFNLGLSIQSKLVSRKKNYNYDFGLHNYLDRLIKSNIKLGNLIEEEFNFHR
jgi:uncharacterized alpha-E superfamily protein